MRKESGNSTRHGSLRERQRLEREEAVLSAAVSLMGNGDGATMDDLAARVGISKPTLYTHFASKEAIYLRVVVRMMADARAFVDGLPEYHPAFARIEAAVRYMLTNKIVHHVAPLGMGGDAMGPALRANPEYRAEYDLLTKRLVRLFDDGRREGTLKPELSPRIAVQAVISLLRDAEYGDLVEYGETDAATIAETLTTILMDGFRAPQAETK